MSLFPCNALIDNLVIPIKLSCLVLMAIVSSTECLETVQPLANMLRLLITWHRRCTLASQNGRLLGSRNWRHRDWISIYGRRGRWKFIYVFRYDRVFQFIRAQLFEGRLALNPGLNLTRVSFSFVQKHFLGQFFLIFIAHRIINLLTKRIKLNLLYKLSYLNSNFALTLGYLNPALNNPAQMSLKRWRERARCFLEWGKLLS